MKTKLLFALVFLLNAHLILSQADSSLADDLFDLSFEELLNVKVSVASKSEEALEDAPGIITVITQEEIQGYVANSLGDILNRITGAILLSPNVFEQNVISFRAQSVTPYDNHTLLMINGRPVRDPISGGWNSAFYNSFPIDIIDRIEVIRGPGSVLYGSCAFSAVINIITKSSDIEGVDISADMRLGNRNTFKQDLSAYFKDKDFKFSFGLSNYITDGPVFSFTDYLGVDSSANFDKRNLGVFLGVEYKDFLLNFDYVETEGFGLNPVNNNWDLGTNFPHNNHQSSGVDFGYNKDFSENLSWRNNMAFQAHEFSESADVEVFAYSLNFESTLNYMPVDNFNFIGGLVLENNIHHGLRFINDEKYTASAYLQLKYSILPKFHFIVGLQWNKPEYISARLSPRAGFIANFTDKLGLKLLFSEAFRNGYPLETSFDLEVFRGNNQLKPEIIQTSEVQIFLHTQKTFVSLTGYYSLMDDLISRKWFVDTSLVGGGYLKYINAGAYKFYGAELEWKSSLLKHLSTNGSFSWQENYNENNLKNATLHPNMMFKFGLLYQNRYLSVGVFNSYFGKPSRVSLVNPDVLMVNNIPQDFNLLSAKLSINLSVLFNTLNVEKFLFYMQAQNILGTDVRYPDYATRGLNSFLPLYNGVSYEFGLHADF
ncbi:MAG: TonB-dependent receptor [Bacteroidales bacterium]|nr:TonB-dependent receptor [Bacteroidales bacterium]